MEIKFIFGLTEISSSTALSNFTTMKFNSEIYLVRVFKFQKASKTFQERPWQRIMSVELGMQMTTMEWMTRVEMRKNCKKTLMIEIMIFKGNDLYI